MNHAAARGWLRDASKRGTRGIVVHRGQSAMALPSTGTTTTTTTPRLKILCCSSLPRLRSFLFFSYCGQPSPWPRPPPAGPAPFVFLPTSQYYSGTGLEVRNVKIGRCTEYVIILALGAPAKCL
ncbi:unnamed protein product [Ectocarpus sp. 8 AP-2014]